MALLSSVTLRRAKFRQLLYPEFYVSKLKLKCYKSYNFNQKLSINNLKVVRIDTSPYPSNICTPKCDAKGKTQNTAKLAYFGKRDLVKYAEHFLFILVERIVRIMFQCNCN